MKKRGLTASVSPLSFLYNESPVYIGGSKELQQEKDKNAFWRKTSLRSGSCKDSKRRTSE